MQDNVLIDSYGHMSLIDNDKVRVLHTHGSALFFIGTTRIAVLWPSSA